MAVAMLLYKVEKDTKTKLSATIDENKIFLSVDFWGFTLEKCINNRVEEVISKKGASDKETTLADDISDIASKAAGRISGRFKQFKGFITQKPQEIVEQAKPQVLSRDQLV